MSKRYVIAGAGKLGRLLAGVLSEAGHTVVLIDISEEKLDLIRGRYDISVQKGNCCDVELLKRADVAGADAFFAVTGDDAANILACRLARMLDSKENICRLYNQSCFSDNPKICASSFNLDYVFSPPDEVSKRLLAVIRRPIIHDEFIYPDSDAKISVVVIPNDSPVQSGYVRDIDRDILNNIRIAAILKNGRLSTKVRGDIILNAGDHLYVCGTSEHVDDFINYVSPDGERKVRKLLLVGSDELCISFARMACACDYEVSIICEKPEIAEDIGDKLGDFAPHVLFYYGNSTDEYLLKEADAESADVFINMQRYDEDNILSCIVAKRLGASKVISVTHRPEYTGIFHEIRLIDCVFCETSISCQNLIAHLGVDVSHLDRISQNVRATVAEFLVTSASGLCNKRIMDAELPESVTFALIFRNGESITPIGSTILMEGDRILVLGKSEIFRKLEELLPRKKE